MSWSSAVRHNWFVVARGSDVTAKPHSVDVFGSPVALARLRDGRIVALEDRCPHRHAPLSSGRVIAEGLQCPYHGWTFAADGHCTLLPGLKVCATTPQARSFATMERDGLVWLAHGSAAPAELPRAVRETDPAQRRFLWQTQWQAPVVECLENFLDALHTHYVHAGLVRNANARRRIDATLTSDAEGFTVDYRDTGHQAGNQTGLLYRLFESQRTSERAVFAAPGTAQIEYCYRSGSRVLITLYFTPATQSVTHVFTTLHVSGRWAPAWAVRCFVWPFLKRVAAQDARMLKLQTLNRARFAPTRYASTPADLVRPYLDRVWSPEPGTIELPKQQHVALLI